MKEYYSIMLDVSNRIIKIVGGGKVAERKVQSLLNCGARIEIISPNFTPKLFQYFEEGKIHLVKRKYKYGDLEGSFLVYATTDDSDIQNLCKKECEERNILLNSAKEPHVGDFIVPSTINRGNLTISISTNGKSPMLSKKIRADLEKNYPENYSKYIEVLGILRSDMKKNIHDIEIRKRIFHKLVYSSEIEDIIRSEDIYIEEKLYDIYRQAYVHINNDMIGEI